MKVVNGDIFDSGAEYIMHQCNCLTVRPHGLSKQVAVRLGKDKDVYSTRRAEKHRNCAIPEDRAMPGTIQILDGDGPTVLALFGQYRPGKPCQYALSYPDDGYSDDAEAREINFREALKALRDHFAANTPSELTRVAVPFGIGCGLAGGDWSRYSKMLQTAHLAMMKYNVEMVVYKYNC